MELVTQHRIYYSNKDLVPIGDIAESLIALERLIKSSSPVLERIFPGTRIFSINVFVEELKSGSVTEDIVVKFIFGSQERLDEFIDTSRKLVGLDYLSKHPKIFFSIILAMMMSGGIYTLKKNVFSNQKDIKQLEIHNDTYINFGAKSLEMLPEQFQLAIESGINDKEKISKSSIKLIQPARRDRAASIKFDDTQDLTLSPESIKAMPSFIKEEENDETLEEFKGVELNIRATDLDSPKRGWAAVVPSISNKRTRLQLDAKINPEELMAKKSVLGDVTVVFTFDENEKKVPKLIYLRNLSE